MKNNVKCKCNFLITNCDLNDLFYFKMQQQQHKRKAKSESEWEEINIVNNFNCIFFLVEARAKKSTRKNSVKHFFAKSLDKVNSRMKARDKKRKKRKTKKRLKKTKWKWKWEWENWKSTRVATYWDGKAKQCLEAPRAVILHHLICN